MGLLTPVIVMVASRLLGSDTGFDRLLVSIEVPNVLAAKPDVVTPFGSQSNAGNGPRASFVSLGVLPICSITDAPQILNSVIKAVPVDVIDVFRPVSSFHAPDHAVGELRLIEDGALKIAMASDVSERRFSGKLPVPHLGVGRRSMKAAILEQVRATFAPSQNAGVAVVFQQFIKNIGGKVGLIHWGLSDRSLWSGLAERWNALQAHYFSQSLPVNTTVEV